MDRHRRSLNRAPRALLALLALPAVVFVGAFYVWPVIALAAKAVDRAAVTTVLHDSTLRHIAWFTTWQALLSTALTVVIGLAPAWALSRFDFRGRRMINALVTVPFVLPTVVVGAAFLALLPASVHQGVLAILVAHVFFNIAVIVRGVGSMWEQLSPDLVAAARTLGASPWRAMRTVTLPLLAPAIAASASVVFLFTFTSFGVVRVLGGPANPTVEVEIWQRATRLGDAGVAAVMSIAQLIVLGLAVAWFARVQARRRTALGLQPIARRRRLGPGRQRRAVGVVCAITVLTVAAPLVALVEQSLRTGAGRHSLAAWRSVFASTATTPTRPGTAVAVDAFGALTTSLRFAVIAMVFSVVVGGCAALAIVSLGRSGRALDTGIMLPLGTSAVTIGFGLILAFDTPPFDWARAAPLLIPLGHALVATPFVVRVMLPVLRAIPNGQRAAAATLGASPARVWREVDLRAAARPLITGAGFALAISLGEFGATSFLTRSGRATLPIAIDQLLGRPVGVVHAQAYVLATVLAGLTFVAIAAVELIGGGRLRRARSS